MHKKVYKEPFLPYGAQILCFLLFLLIGCSTDSDNNLICKESAGELIISTAEELIEFAKLVNDGDDFLCKTVKLSANIMLNDTTDWQSWGEGGLLVNHPITSPANTWTSIGHSRNRSFNGTFDGNGFVVSGVYTRLTGGFFGWLDSNGTIENLGVVASYIGYKNYVGGLVNLNYGKISNSYFIGLVYGDANVGGLVGDNNSTINNSYSSGTVLGTRNNVGGLVGVNSGTINNSYSNSAAKGATILGGAIAGDRVGGLVGCNASLINNSYSSGIVAGRSGNGGLVGYDAQNDNYCKGTINNSYYDKETSYQNDQGKGEGKTTAEMKQQITFDGWDFGSIWGISDTINDGYPYLLK